HIQCLANIDQETQGPQWPDQPETQRNQSAYVLHSYGCGENRTPRLQKASRYLHLWLLYFANSDSLHNPGRLSTPAVQTEQCSQARGHWLGSWKTPHSAHEHV